ncbi:MAG: hypothetical protein AB7P99_04775 [Vicinamibacterales bacterium]
MEPKTTDQVVNALADHRRMPAVRRRTDGSYGAIRRIEQARMHERSFFGEMFYAPCEGRDCRECADKREIVEVVVLD